MKRTVTPDLYSLDFAFWWCSKISPLKKKEKSNFFFSWKLKRGVGTYEGEIKYEECHKIILALFYHLQDALWNESSRRVAKKKSEKDTYPFKDI